MATCPRRSRASRCTWRSTSGSPCCASSTAARASPMRSPPSCSARSSPPPRTAPAWGSTSPTSCAGPTTPSSTTCRCPAAAPASASPCPPSTRCWPRTEAGPGRGQQFPPERPIVVPVHPFPRQAGHRLSHVPEADALVTRVKTCQYWSPRDEYLIFMNEARSALIVDDEHDIRELLVLTLGRMGLRTDTAPNLHAARQMLGTVSYDLCLTDMRLPDGSGLELVSEISTRFPTTPVAVITAYGNVEAAVEALKAGAFDFVSKPVDINVLRGLVRQALDLNTRRLAEPEEAGRLLGSSPAMVTLRQTIAKVARGQAPVHISGESGTGKELVARTIHAQGSRAGGPFIPVNCGAIPSELMESEFFGHRKGSFTGATSDKAGLFQAADGGTLFLDEVAELPLAMQVK